MITFSWIHNYRSSWVGNGERMGIMILGGSSPVILVAIMASNGEYRVFVIET